MDKELGIKIKTLRTSKNFTLKDLSEKTNLSIGYISQLERGLTSAAISTLNNIAKVLEVDLSYFFSVYKEDNKRIIRSYEQKVTLVRDPLYIYYSLANRGECKDFTPALVNLLPTIDASEETLPYSHDGEEFIYVLEGILTLFIGDVRHDLYPGDSYHISSNTPHNWCNYTSKLVKILTINSKYNF
ncbi:helix-turn-helix domain-containing protein [Alkaliphilus peptidifermentans]|uniref:Transcriptional regulator, XRE family with cupin sensor n=1 Tax=Alkaliphilus peptidifermentans DSM 18978 TaxID=1120976 RepID=A0A1G5CEH6_9FIRM|nr:XRE family transcriptional regulator [Alkaliphilus peptidifermentans]SCY00721.1 transcriptional regulator, XRE family with cupin sensor [Alkaliphilus peptidifermentans DSM 18978]